jgi:hypothetical protein
MEEPPERAPTCRPWRSAGGWSGDHTQALEAFELDATDAFTAF